MTYQGGVRAVPLQKSWELVAPLVRPNWVTFEVGSAEGWFTRRLSERGGLVVAWEQSLALPLTWPYQDNVLLFNHRLDDEDLGRWRWCVETIDCVLALNTLHHVTRDEAYSWTAAASGVSHTMILEMPSGADGGDTGAWCADGEVGRMLERFYPEVCLVGSNSTGKHSRDVWLARGSDPSREGCYATNPGSKATWPEKFGFGPHDLQYDPADDVWLLSREHGQWREIRRGFNLQNSLFFNRVSPVGDRLGDMVHAAGLRQAEAQGYRINNLGAMSFILGEDGVFCIDTTDGHEPEWRAELDATAEIMRRGTWQAFLELHRG